MARGPNKESIPAGLLAKQPWTELLQRLTAVAVSRMRGRPADDARQLAVDAIKTFLDPDSTVVWDYETESDPRYCLGSILNGLLRNYFRAKRITTEVTTEAEQIDQLGPISHDTPEERLLARNFAQAVFARARELSEKDSEVCQLIELARLGVVEIDEQLAALSISRPALYEARRRLRECLDIARAELEV